MPLNAMVTADASAEQLEKDQLNRHAGPLAPACPENVCERRCLNRYCSTAPRPPHRKALMVPVTLKLTVLRPHKPAPEGEQQNGHREAPCAAVSHIHISPSSMLKTCIHYRHSA
ncbi:hypothetical protein J4733_03320 [Klebsiella pneumoniae]|uniref:Uncharacterized protein n=1 Tax=Klebsiella pneumoniae TaxID=573 RepID=A0A939SV09_KLEPN|nr:hypothetical protein [Klebsiella pneumoniae]